MRLLLISPPDILASVIIVTSNLNAYRFLKYKIIYLLICLLMLMFANYSDISSLKAEIFFWLVLCCISNSKKSDFEVVSIQYSFNANNKQTSCLWPCG